MIARFSTNPVAARFARSPMQSFRNRAPVLVSADALPKRPWAATRARLVHGA